MGLSKNAIALATAGLLMVGAGSTVALAAGNDGQGGLAGSESGQAAGPAQGVGLTTPDQAGRNRGTSRDEMLSRLATSLGVSKDKLRTALTEVREQLRTSGAANQTRDQREAAFAKALASKLGLDESKVTNALTQLRTQAQTQRASDLKPRLDAQVKAGRLTQAEADAILSAVRKGAIDAHVPGGGMGAPGLMGGMGHGHHGMHGRDGDRTNGQGNGSAANGSAANGGTTSSPSSFDA